MQVFLPLFSSPDISFIRSELPYFIIPYRSSVTERSCFFLHFSLRTLLLLSYRFKRKAASLFGSRRAPLSGESSLLSQDCVFLVLSPVSLTLEKILSLYSFVVVLSFFGSRSRFGPLSPTRLIPFVSSAYFFILGIKESSTRLFLQCGLTKGSKAVSFFLLKERFSPRVSL